VDIYFDGDPILGVAMLDKDRILALTGEKLALLNLTTGEVYWFTPTTSPLTSGMTITPTSHYHPIATDSTGKVWISSDYGITALYYEKQIQVEEEVTVYPNPVDLSKVKGFSIRGVKSKPEVYIYTVSGERISQNFYEVDYDKNSSVLSISIKEPEKYAPGLYILLLKGENWKKTVKFAILR
jgi:hypothetical protein